MTSSSMISSGSPPPKTGGDAQTYNDIPTFFAQRNLVYGSFKPSIVHDLCLLELEPIDAKQVWVPTLIVNANPPLAATGEAREEYFVVGSPNGLPLKISGHGANPERTSPRILSPVESWYSDFTCDVDILAGKRSSRHLHVNATGAN